jgi:hypothetical protein
LPIKPNQAQSRPIKRNPAQFSAIKRNQGQSLLLRLNHQTCHRQESEALKGTQEVINDTG